MTVRQRTFRFLRHLVRALGAVAVLLLGACGGDGDDQGVSAEADEDEPSSSTTTTTSDDSTRARGDDRRFSVECANDDFSSLTITWDGSSPGAPSEREAIAKFLRDVFTQSPELPGDIPPDEPSRPGGPDRSREEADGGYARSAPGTVVYRSRNRDVVSFTLESPPAGGHVVVEMTACADVDEHGFAARERRGE